MLSPMSTIRHSCVLIDHHKATDSAFASHSTASKTALDTSQDLRTLSLHNVLGVDLARSSFAKTLPERHVLAQRVHARGEPADVEV
ncbi:MAG: hypothetical protein LZF62_340229 [Nitrospira sp.]|nr:MAG: hypothetical protein LZF62_340229 [Nitrospira sp.]